MRYACKSSTNRLRCSSTRHRTKSKDPISIEAVEQENSEQRNTHLASHVVHPLLIHHDRIRRSSSDQRAHCRLVRAGELRSISIRFRTRLRGGQERNGSKMRGQVNNEEVFPRKDSRGKAIWLEKELQSLKPKRPAKERPQPLNVII